MIGFLSPSGIFTECESWGHLDKAVEICKNIHSKDFYNRQDAEDYLLSLGYLVLRARDAYMSYYDKDRNHILLTEFQIKFLTENMDSLNDRLKEDISKILLDQENLKRWDMFERSKCDQQT